MAGEAIERGCQYKSTQLVFDGRNGIAVAIKFQTNFSGQLFREVRFGGSNDDHDRPEIFY